MHSDKKSWMNQENAYSKAFDAATPWEGILLIVSTFFARVCNVVQVIIFQKIHGPILTIFGYFAALSCI